MSYSTTDLSNADLFTAWMVTPLYALCNAYREEAERSDDHGMVEPITGSDLLTARARLALATLDDDLHAYGAWLRSYGIDEDIADRLIRGMEWQVRLLVDLGAAFTDRAPLRVIGVDPALIFSQVVATAYLGLIGASTSGPLETQEAIRPWSHETSTSTFAAFRQIWANAIRGETDGCAYLDFPAIPIVIPGGSIILHDYHPMVGLHTTTLRSIGGATYLSIGYHGLEDSIMSQQLAENALIRIQPQGE